MHAVFSFRQICELSEKFKVALLLQEWTLFIKHVQVEADFIKTWTLHCEYSNCAVFFNTCRDWSIQGDDFFFLTAL